MANSTTEMTAIQLIELGQLAPFLPTGSRTMRRLENRQWLRPAGNSARFWKKIEADDPFKPARTRVSPHRSVYASGRFVRLADAEPPKPVPTQQPVPQAKRIARLQPDDETSGPSQVHTPDRKALPSPIAQPKPRPTAVESAPKAVERSQPNEPIDRTPPTIIPGGTKKTSGRIRTNTPPRRRSRKLVQGGVPPTSAPTTPADVPAANSAEAEPPPDISPDRNLGKRESPPPPAARNLDSVLGILGNLRAAQDQYEHEQDLKAKGIVPPSTPKPTPTPSTTPSQAKQVRPSTPATNPSDLPPTARKRTFGTESAPAPEARSLDSVLGALGALKAAQAQYEREKEQKEHGLPSDAELFGEGSPPRKAPQPKRIAKPAPSQAAPPPKPQPSPKPATPNRAPPKPGGGNLDDLFGGSNEGRLRIGKRSKPKSDSS